jgi:hypothetical protein
MRTTQIGVALINCGKACGDIVSQCALIGVVTSAFPSWHVIFMCEVDAHRTSSQTVMHSGHMHFRHWPGEGSLPMQFVVKHSVKHLVRNVTWRGRCGALHLFQKGHNSTGALNLYILGVHNSHGDLQVDTLADVAYLLKHRPRGSKVPVAGDWNVDQLPMLTNDPFQDVDHRELRHADERLWLHCLADQFHLHLELPRAGVSVPGGPFALHCHFAPISRVPVGAAALTDLPSWIMALLAPS